MTTVERLDRAARRARALWPKRPHKVKEEWEVKVLWLVVQSRRAKGLGAFDRMQFRQLVEVYLDEIARWPERWIVSVLDTFGENGDPAALVGSALRFMEQYANPQPRHGELERNANPRGGDNHVNLGRRTREAAGSLVVWRLVREVFERLVRDPETVLGRYQKLSPRDLVGEFVMGENLAMREGTEGTEGTKGA